MVSTVWSKVIRTLWTDKMQNVDILKEAKTKRELVTCMRERQSTFFWAHQECGKTEYVVNNGRALIVWIFTK